MFHETGYTSFTHTHTTTSVNRCGCFRPFISVYDVSVNMCTSHLYFIIVYMRQFSISISYLTLKLFRVISLYDVSLNMCTLHLYFINVYTRHLSMYLSHLTLNRSELIFRYLFSRNVTYASQKTRTKFGIYSAKDFLYTSSRMCHQWDETCVGFTSRTWTDIYDHER